MANIAVDIDSTLYDFDSIAREILAHMTREQPELSKALYASWDQWRTPADLVGLDNWMECIRRTHDSEMILKQVPFPGAVETCQALMKEGHQLLYISNRATETEEATGDWLVNNGFFDAPEKIRVPAALVVTTGDKAPYMTECQYLIDDRLKTCVQFVYDFDWLNDRVYAHDPMGEINYVRPASTRRKAFVKSYPYNHNATDIPGLYLAPTWAGLALYMEKKGLLSTPVVMEV